MGFGEVIGGLLSGGLGGIVGAIGAIGGKIIDLKLEGEKRETLKLQFQHELNLRDKDMAQAQFEAQNKLELSKIDADTAKVTADLNALSTAVTMDKATYGDSVTGRIVDFIRGIVRPVLTAWAAALVTFDTVQAFKSLLGVPLTQVQALTLIQDAQFLAGLAIAYWFGSRPNRK